MTTSAEDYGVDPWPQVDGEDWNGKNLLSLLHAGQCPITAFNVKILIEEIEDALRINIVDIPLVSSGANNYGFHMKSIGHPDIVARLAKVDLNWPSFDNLFYQKQARDAMFEAAAYGLLAPVSAVKVSKLIYHRLPVLQEGPRSKTPPGIAGRQLLIFNRAESGDAVKIWKSASHEGKVIPNPAFDAERTANASHRWQYLSKQPARVQLCSNSAPLQPLPKNGSSIVFSNRSPKDYLLQSSQVETSVSVCYQTRLRLPSETLVT